MGAPASRRAPRALRRGRGQRGRPADRAGRAPRARPLAGALLHRLEREPRRHHHRGRGDRRRRHEPARAGLLPPARLRGALLPARARWSSSRRSTSPRSSRSRSSAAERCRWSSPSSARSCCAARMCAWQARNHERHRQELSRVSRADPLTGCLNRRGFEERFAAELGGAQRARAAAVARRPRPRPLQGGQRHGTGTPPATSCCAGSSARCARTLRPGDVVGRLGGDEFAVLLRRTAPRRRAIVDRLLRALAERDGGARRGRRASRSTARPPTALQQAADARALRRASATAPRTPPPRRAS